MLRDGQFIKDIPVSKAAPYDTGKIKIGQFYVPKTREEENTPEERFVQDLLLGCRHERHSFLSKVFGYILRV